MPSILGWKHIFFLFPDSFLWFVLPFFWSIEFLRSRYKLVLIPNDVMRLDINGHFNQSWLDRDQFQHFFLYFLKKKNSFLPKKIWKRKLLTKLAWCDSINKTPWSRKFWNETSDLRVNKTSQKKTGSCRKRSERICLKMKWINELLTCKQKN